MLDEKPLWVVIFLCWFCKVTPNKGRCAEPQELQGVPLTLVAAQPFLGGRLHHQISSHYLLTLHLELFVALTVQTQISYFVCQVYFLQSAAECRLMAPRFVFIEFVQLYPPKDQRTLTFAGDQLFYC